MDAVLLPEPDSVRSTRPRVHKEVVSSLARRILSGEIAPGALLPSTDTLCADLGISRTALRESIRVLAAKGLVEMRPRTGTRVRAQECWRLLDPEVLGWLGPALDTELVTSLLECRRLIEPEAAAMAARRASAAQVAAIEAAYNGMAAALHPALPDGVPSDLDACCEADLAFHLAVLRASGNIILMQLASTLSAALLATFRLSTQLADSHRQSLSLHRDVLEAIRLRDSSRAAQAMRDLISIAARHLEPALGER